MKADDVTDTLEMALAAAAGLDEANGAHRPTSALGQRFKLRR